MFYLCLLHMVACRSTIVIRVGVIHSQVIIAKLGMSLMWMWMAHEWMPLAGQGFGLFILNPFLFPLAVTWSPIRGWPECIQGSALN